MFSSDDPGCQVLYEMSYLDSANQKVIFPTSGVQSYILYHSDPTTNMLHIFYNKPLINADSGKYPFKCRAYIDLSDSVSSTDPLVTPNESIQDEQFNLIPNCATVALTPSALNN